MSTSPSVTALMTVYKTPTRYLVQAIESLHNQTVKPDRTIVVIDGEDGIDPYTLQMHLVGSPLDMEILLKKTNVGLTACLNLALERIDTDYILRQDADDVSVPERLEVSLAYMQEHLKCGAVGDNYAYVNEAGKIVHINTADPQLVPAARYRGHGMAGTIAGGGVMLRTEAVKQVGGWKYPVAQDCYMWHALQANGWTVNSVKRTLYHWRKHSGQISVTRQQEQRQVVQQILAQFEQPGNA